MRRGGRNTKLRNNIVISNYYLFTSHDFRSGGWWWNPQTLLTYDPDVR